MTKEEFEKLVDKDKYQVFIFTCPAFLLLAFAFHPWVVVNKKGALSRYDVFHKKKTDGSYMYKDYTDPTNGVTIFYPYEGILWPSKLFKVIEGPDAERMITVIENSKNTYPYKNKYRLSGPNSNTYMQWIIDQFPDLKIKLPWRCIGKNYKVK